MVGIRPQEERQSSSLAPLAAVLAIPTTTPHGWTIFTRAGDIDGQLAALEFFVVEHLHSFVRFVGGRELDESKPTGFACELVHHQVDGIHDTCLGEVLLEVVFHRLVREVTDEESRLAHNDRWLHAQEPSGGMLPWQ